MMSWNSVGVAFDNKDAQALPFFSDVQSNIIKDNKLTIDITSLYTKYRAGSENNGFIITFSEKKENETNHFVIMTSESDQSPELKFYN